MTDSPTPEKMRQESPDLAALNVEKIASLFPNCVTEAFDESGKPKKAVNFELLKQMLSDSVLEGDEAYEFTWVGKKASIVEANKPIRKTLRPCPEESKNWDETENLYIEGDNLEVLKLLQESYLGKVKMIYIDPPYNTGHDFVYPDSFIMDNEEYNEGTGYFDEEGKVNYKRENAETAGKYHSDWCSMMYSRLLLARNLLREDGIIFISIDDYEQDNLKKICDELFGANNFISCLPRVTKKAGKTTDVIAKNHDYILTYRKSERCTFYLPSHTDDGFKYSDEFEAERGKYKLNQTLDYDSLQYSSSLDYPITIDSETFYPGQSYEKYLERKNGNYARADWAWRWSRELFDYGYKNGFVVIKKYDGYSRIYTKTYQNCRIIKTSSGFGIEYIQRTKAISSLELVDNKFSNDNAKKNLVNVFENSVFDYSKPLSLLYTLSSYSTNNDDILLDFFSGSATTAHAVMQLNAEDGGNRKFIMVQLPEPCDEKSEAYKAGYKTIPEIGKERIRRAGAKLEEAKKETQTTLDDVALLKNKLDTGFRVFKLDDSNMRDVYYHPNEYSKDNLEALLSNIKDDRNDLDVLFGCILDWGLPLSSKFYNFDVEGVTAYAYGMSDEEYLLHTEHMEITDDGCIRMVDGFKYFDISAPLIACFEDNIPEAAIIEIAKLKPLRVVFRDSCFADSPSKINVFEIFKLYNPERSDDVTKWVKVL